MDEIKTISLPLLPNLLPKVEGETQGNEFKLAHLFRLGQHYWAKDFSKGQAKEFLRDYLEDLELCSAAQVETACRDWRRNTENKRFPRPAELSAICNERRALSAPKEPITESRPILWWMLPRTLWRPTWKESEAPPGERITP